MILLIVGIVLIAAALHIFVTSMWECFCYLMVALMVSPDSKPSSYSFSINWKTQYLPTVLGLAGILILVLR